jgi:hypothetical protein
MNRAITKARLSYRLGSVPGLRLCVLRITASLLLYFLVMTMSVDELTDSVDSSNAL